jgi:hypothetical protein
MQNFMGLHGVISQETGNIVNIAVKVSKFATEILYLFFEG